MRSSVPVRPRWRNFLEPAVWTAALAALFLLDPARSSFSLCLFRLLGFGRCPGCGLGHAIHYALHLDWRQSVQAHWLGIPATVGLLYAIFSSLHTTYVYHQWTKATCSGRCPKRSPTSYCCCKA